jgi:hypothetical protein
MISKSYWYLNCTTADIRRVTVYRLAGRPVMNGEVYPWFISDEIFWEVEVVKHVQETN